MRLRYGLTVIFLLLLNISQAVAQSEPNFAVAERYELKGGHVLLYDKDYLSLAIQFKGAEPEMVSDYCSYPAVKPDKSVFAFLEPWGFEENSQLLLYTIATSEIEVAEIPDIPKSDTAKEIVWLNDQLLLIIAGYASGTVTAGGKLYFYHAISHDSGLIIDTRNLEIAAIKLDDNQAVLTLVSREYWYHVANYIKILRDTDMTTISLKELHRLIAAQETITISELPEKQVLYRLQALAGWLYGKVLEQHGLDPVTIIIKRD